MQSWISQFPTIFHWVTHYPFGQSNVRCKHACLILCVYIWYERMCCAGVCKLTYAVHSSIGDMENVLSWSRSQNWNATGWVLCTPVPVVVLNIPKVHIAVRALHNKKRSHFHFILGEFQCMNKYECHHIHENEQVQWICMQDIGRQIGLLMKLLADLHINFKSFSFVLCALTFNLLRADGIVSIFGCSIQRARVAKVNCKCQMDQAHRSSKSFVSFSLPAAFGSEIYERASFNQ